MQNLKNLGIKIYADGAQAAQILEFLKLDAVVGFTTNPSLMKAANVKDYETFAKGLLDQIGDRSLSLEVFADEIPEMIRQGKKLASWGSSVYVKVPVTNTKGESTAPVLRELSHEGIALNVTALFTVAQVKEVHAALNPKARSILSVFAGRIADTGRNPLPCISECRKFLESQKSHSELLWASSRQVYNVVEAAEAGAHIITMSPDLIKKLSMFGKDLLQLSLETVQTFYKDAQAAGFKL